ncbi:MAG: Holliday junction resolvase RuvX [Campylobacterales bacterium]
MSIIGVDLGLKRVGLAMHTSNITLPLKPIIRKNRNQAAKELDELLQEKRATKVIFGIPKGGSSEDEMTRRIEHFSKLLNFSGDIEFVDESFSSSEAKELTKGVLKDKKDGKLDSLSALLILERWVEKNPNCNQKIS